MRARLHTAVRALLDDPRLAGLNHASLLAALVLMAKADHRSCTVKITARELGRWIGLSESSIGHDVLPALVTTKTVSTQVATAPSGRTQGLVCRVEPLWEAHGKYGTPLALTKRDFAVLLRLMEVLQAPGWANSPSPPGLLASRQSKGAATDRLALLLLVLRCRNDGTVPLVGGTVTKGRGRCAATLARLLGCSVSGASKVLTRLRRWGIVQTPHRVTRSGMRGKQVLLVPAVAAVSCGVPFSSDSPDPASSTADAKQQDGPGERPDTAPGDLDISLARIGPGQSAESDGDEQHERQIMGRPGTGTLHTSHAGVAEAGEKAEVEYGFSGSAVGSAGRLREHARVREEATNCHASTASAHAGPGCGPLRGENRGSLSVNSGQNGNRVSHRHLAVIPNELRQALAPVAELWGRIHRSSTRVWLTHRVHAEIQRLRGLVGPEFAQQVLADRLDHRLDRQAPHQVEDPVGWLLRRGLPQRPGCWSALCDQGVRIDTRAACESCQVLVADRRSLRQRVAGEVLADRLTGRIVVPQQKAGREVERRLQTAVRTELARRVAARERSVTEQVVREASYERKRQAAAAAERARAALPCADCGRADAAGLCMTCTERRGMEAAFEDAVAIAVAMRFDPNDVPAMRALLRQCDAETRGLLEERLGRLRDEGLEEAVVSFTGRRLVEQLLQRRRRTAIQQLGHTDEAEQAAQVAAARVRRSQQVPNSEEGRREARDAGERARKHVAERWLRELVAEVRVLCSTGPAVTALVSASESGPWTFRSQSAQAASSGG